MSGEAEMWMHETCGSLLDAAHRARTGIELCKYYVENVDNDCHCWNSSGTGGIFYLASRLSRERTLLRHENGKAVDDDLCASFVVIKTRSLQHLDL
jgi:hypothetical protein